MFRTRRAKDSSNVFDFTGPPNGVYRLAAPDINAESSPLSIFMLFFRQIFQIILEEMNCYCHQYMASKNTTSTSAQPPDITIGEIHIFCNYNAHILLFTLYFMNDQNSQMAQNTHTHFRRYQFTMAHTTTLKSTSSETPQTFTLCPPS